MSGGVEKFKGKGIGFIKRTFQTYQQRRKALLDDGAVEELLFIAYTMRIDDMMGGVAPCRTGFEVAKRVKERLI